MIKYKIVKEYSNEFNWNKDKEIRLNRMIEAYKLLYAGKVNTGSLKEEIREARAIRRAWSVKFKLARQLRSGVVVSAEIERTHEGKTGSVVTRKLLEYLRNDLKTRIRYIRQDLNHVETQEKEYHGVYYSLRGGVHTGEGTFVDLIKRAARARVRSDKSPTNSVRHIGVEIEFLSTETQDEIGALLVKANLDRHVTLKTDGSVKDEDADCDGSCRDSCECCECDEHCGMDSCECSCDCNCGANGHEICVLATEKDYPRIIASVCKVLSQANAFVNSTCGLHVHLDMRDRDAKRAYRNLVRSQELLYSMVPNSRRTGGYSKPNRDETFDPQSGNRYRGINPTAYDKHKTIEVRIHSGTTNAIKIVNWVTLLVRIANAKGVKQPVTNLSNVPKAFRLNAILRSYIETRIKTFNRKPYLEEAA
jgi:hypothetical protein